MKIGNTEVKFNFKALFRANALLSTQADAKDGASQLWLQFVTGDENEAVDWKSSNDVKITAPTL